MGKILNKVKEKAKDVKDKVAGRTKDAAVRTKDTVKTQSSSSNQEREYEGGDSGKEKGRKDDPLTEYRENEPMTPAKIKEHEPTAVKRDQSDQKITKQGQTGTDTEQANEQYRKRGMTKADSDYSETS